MKLKEPKHDCFWAHSDPKDLNCKICVKRKNCTKNKTFPIHDCYYSPEQRAAIANCGDPAESNCFHRFYCTGKNVLAEPSYKYKVVEGKILLNVKGRTHNPGD